MTQNASNLIWIDLEMTGLDSSSDQIIEIATVVTDANLETVAEGPVIAIHQPDEIIEGMDDWNTRTHGESGLIQRVRESWYSVSEADAKTLEFLEQYGIYILLVVLVSGVLGYIFRPVLLATVKWIDLIQGLAI